MLVDHAKATVDRVAGGGKADRFPAQENLAVIGRIEAVENIHQGGLASPILAEQRVNLALTQVKIDAGVGDDSRESLDDPTHFDDR
jgi:hypothetical protein